LCAFSAFSMLYQAQLGEPNAKKPDSDESGFFMPKMNDSIQDKNRSYQFRVLSFLSKS